GVAELVHRGGLNALLQRDRAVLGFDVHTAPHSVELVPDPCRAAAGGGAALAVQRPVDQDDANSLLAAGGAVPPVLEDDARLRLPAVTDGLADPLSLGGRVPDDGGLEADLDVRLGPDA